MLDKNVFRSLMIEVMATISMMQSMVARIMCMNLEFFRGTLNPMIYLATLQFVDNFMRIVHDIVERIRRNDITFEDITNVTFNDILGYKAYEELMTYVDSLFSNVE